MSGAIPYQLRRDNSQNKWGMDCVLSLDDEVHLPPSTDIERPVWLTFKTPFLGAQTAEDPYLFRTELGNCIMKAKSAAVANALTDCRAFLLEMKARPTRCRSKAKNKPILRPYTIQRNDLTSTQNLPLILGSYYYVVYDGFTGTVTLMRKSLFPQGQQPPRQRHE